MATATMLSSSCMNKEKKRKRRFLPHNKPVKKDPSPLRPGVQGFFITCDAGRERQAAQDAIIVIESFYEELLDRQDKSTKFVELPNKPVNKKIKFSYHDDEDNDDEINKKDGEEHARPISEDSSRFVSSIMNEKMESRSIDHLIEDELKELGDKSKRVFLNLDSGCNGVIFVQMHMKEGDPSPKDIVHHMMESVALTKKFVSRFLLRVLPIEATCYASEEEISKAMLPIVERYFPSDSQDPQKFAVLYEARANTGVERMRIIDTVAKLVPRPHRVDLNNPDKTIVVEIVKTVCLLGVVEKYKQFAKNNLRQLTSSKRAAHISS